MRTAKDPRAYAVTARGKLRAGASLSTFRLHFAWAGVATALLAASFGLDHGYLPLRVWCGLTLLASLGPPAMAAVSHLRGRFRGGAPTVRAAAPAPGLPAQPTLILPQISPAQSTSSLATLEMPRPRTLTADGTGSTPTMLLPVQRGHAWPVNAADQAAETVHAMAADATTVGHPANAAGNASAAEAANAAAVTDTFGDLRREPS